MKSQIEIDCIHEQNFQQVQTSEIRAIITDTFIHQDISIQLLSIWYIPALTSKFLHNKAIVKIWGYSFWKIEQWPTRIQHIDYKNSVTEITIQLHHLIAFAGYTEHYNHYCSWLFQ